MPLYTSEKYEDPRAQAAAQDAAATKARTGSINPTFDPAAPTPATYSPDPTKPTALNPLGTNSNPAGNYLTAPSNVPDIPRPVATNSGAPPQPAPSLPVSRPIGAAVAANSTAPVGAAATTPSPVVDPSTQDLDSAGVLKPVAASGTATVNGVPVSSDTINRLANTNVIPSASFRNPGIGTIGTPVSSEQGIQAAASNIPRPVNDAIQSAYDQALNDQQTAARNAEANRNAILNRDPRSTMGTAASNASVDMKDALRSTHDPRVKQAIYNFYGGQIGDLVKGTGADLQTTAGAGTQFQRDVGEQLRGEAAARERALANEMFRPQGQLVDTGDSTLGQVLPNGILRPVVDANGQLVRRAAPKTDNEAVKLTQDRQNAIAKMANDIEVKSRTPDGKPTLPSGAALKQAYEYHNLPLPQNIWMQAQRVANPAMTDDQLAKRYQAYAAGYGR